jgi:hypothetical protein
VKLVIFTVSELSELPEETSGPGSVEDNYNPAV